MSISYQLHSRNDLREWNAMFRKGATSLKIDPHFLKTSHRFYLSHDTPVPGQFPYSTLDDVLDYFESPPFYLYGRSISIALCFKAAPKPLCQHNSTESHQWMSMADAFFARAGKIVQQLQGSNNISLTFVLDGDAKPCDCLSEKFKPWNSTWISTDECSKQCYKSREGFCERFTVLNEPTRSNWSKMATMDAHYGKFGRMNHSLQVWEPDAQREISNLIEGYLQGVEEGVPSGTGLAFAINIDFSMFDVFASRSVAATDSKGFSRLIQDGINSTAIRPNLRYQSPGTMALEYWVQNKPVTRKLTFEPFSRIHVGAVSSESGKEESIPNFVDRKIADSDMSLYGKIISNYFGHSELSWSVEKVDSFTFLFVAAGGKVYASVRSDQVEFPSFSVIGLGVYVHASSLNDTLLVVTEGNHCYNSHVHNTQTGPLVCSPTTRIADGCPYALDYSVGTAENWFHWLQQPLTVITPCNEYILHGSFSGGRRGSGALFPLDDKPENMGKIGIMVAHEPYPLQEESTCGTPATDEFGIIISAFASQVVREPFTEVFVLKGSRNTRTWAGKWEYGIASGMLLLVLIWTGRRWYKQSTNSYEAIESDSTREEEK